MSTETDDVLQFKPKNKWVKQPKNLLFETFNGAVCTDVQFTFSHGNPGETSTSLNTQKLGTESEVVNYALHDNGPNSSKAIFCVRSRDPRDGLLPLPLSEQAYRKLEHRYELPHSIFTTLYTGLSTVHQSVSNGFQTYMFQQNATGNSSTSMIISHSTADNSTLSVVFGAAEFEAYHVLEFLKESGLAPHWSALPLAALEYSADDYSNEIKARHNDVWEVGNKLKMDDWAKDTDGFDIMNLDLVSASRNLNSLFVLLAFYSQACQTSQSLLRDLAIMLETENFDGDSPQNRRRKPVLRKIQHLRSWYDGIQARSNYLLRRTETLQQTVYNLISQRDNNVNLQIAERSREVAEESAKIATLSREDNLAMREVAIATAKDSATMRVIAAVTLFFLPPTFIATFFSTSFFDFKPLDGDHVSAWLWLYFVLTVAMVVIVMVFWELSSRHNLKKIPKAA